MTGSGSSFQTGLGGHITSGSGPGQMPLWGARSAEPVALVVDLALPSLTTRGEISAGMFGLGARGIAVGVLKLGARGGVARDTAELQLEESRCKRPEGNDYRGNLSSD